MSLLTLRTCLEQHSRLQRHSRAERLVGLGDSALSYSSWQPFPPIRDTEVFPVKAQTPVETLHMWMAVEENRKGYLLLPLLYCISSPPWTTTQSPKWGNMIHVQETRAEGKTTVALAQKSWSHIEASSCAPSFGSSLAPVSLYAALQELQCLKGI